MFPTLPELTRRQYIPIHLDEQGPRVFSSHKWKDVKTYPHMINLWHIYRSFWGKCR